MRSFYLQVILAIAFFCAPNIVEAQQPIIFDISTTDSCSQGVIFRFNSTGTNYITHYGDGTFGGGTIAQAFLGLNKHVYTSPGTYTVKHVIFNNSTPIDSVQFSIKTTICNSVFVNVYNDLNANCIMDPNEYNYHVGYVEVDSAGVKIDTVMLSQWGYINLVQGKTYTLKLLPIAGATNCTNAIQNITVPIGYAQPHYDLGYQCNSTTPFDLSIIRFRGNYRPVDQSYVGGSLRNISCSSQNAIVTLNFSPKYHYDYAWPVPTTIGGNKITWNFSNVGATIGDNGFWVFLKPNPNATINLGDTIHATASVSPTAGDFNPANNVVLSIDTVISSWDPNSKEVSPAGAIAAGTELTYTINFENLGNDTAFNIHILDTLSDMLDVKSFRLLYASHRVAPMKLKGPNGKTILKFDFADIKLPDSTHPEANKGFVTFKINARKPLVPEVKIENRAGIYFDINPVVMTNSTLNWIEKPQSINDVARAKQAEIYPNPNTGSFTIKTDSKVYNNAKLVNALGQVIAEQTISNTETIIDTRALPAGIYYLLLTDPNGSMAEKIEKK